jgi:hypothetical protein
MPKTKKFIKVTAGRLVHCCCYTPPLSWDPPEVRAKKSKCSSEARKRLNFKYNYEKLQLKIAANIVRGDYFVAFTYSDKHLPASRKEANERKSKFYKDLRKARDKKGYGLKYIKCTHERTSEGRRLHHHDIINACEWDFDCDTIRSLWPYGNADIKRISDSEYYKNDGFLELAQYMAKEGNPDMEGKPKGAQCWTPSRNLKMPVREQIWVDESMTIEAPPDAFVLDTDEKRNEYGAFKYLKYLLPERKPPARKIE